MQNLILLAPMRITRLELAEVIKSGSVAQVCVLCDHHTRMSLLPGSEHFFVFAIFLADREGQITCSELMRVFVGILYSYFRVCVTGMV